MITMIETTFAIYSLNDIQWATLILWTRLRCLHRCTFLPWNTTEDCATKINTMMMKTIWDTFWNIAMFISFFPFILLFFFSVWNPQFRFSSSLFEIPNWVFFYVRNLELSFSSSFFKIPKFLNSSSLFLIS